MVDNNVTMVQASYTDVNNALEGLIGNITQGSGDTSNFASKTDLTNAQSALNTEIVNLQNTINNAGYATEKELVSLADSVPVGTIFAYSSNTIPTGYMLCNGASFDKTQLSDLYSALGSANVPDTRGLFLRGLDTSGNVDNYGGTRSLLSNEEGSYLIEDYGTSAVSFGAGGNPAAQDTKAALGWDQRTNTSTTLTYYSSYTSNTNSTATSLSALNWDMVGIARPKNIAVNYIIKSYKIANYGYSASALTTQGGTLTGNLVGNEGGTLPQVVGMGGNVVVQTFVMTGKSYGSPFTVSFPKPFAANTKPMVWIQTSPDPGGAMQIAMIGNESDGLTPNITNTNFVVWDVYQVGPNGGYAGAGNSAGAPYSFQVLAIGVM